MILGDKLYTLRTKAGLSQEELAEKLNVSRQSVSKWESGSSIPSIDKILELSKLYGISTDYLLKEEMEDLPQEIVADLSGVEEVRELTLDAVTEYLAVRRDCGRKIALGVALCILSIVPMMLFLAMHYAGVGFATEDMAGGIGTGVLLAIVAGAVILFILNGLRLGEYEYLEKEEFRLAYGVAGILEKERKEYLPTFYRAIACSVTLFILSSVPIAVAGVLEAGACILVLLVALLLAMVALGVYMIVQVCFPMGSFDRLLKLGDFSNDKKRENKWAEAFRRVFWLGTTALYLGISFYWNNWGISWIIWPVAALIFAIIRIILGAVLNTED